MRICKFCEDKVAKLIDAHIIPRAFFEYSKKKSNTAGDMIMISNAKKVLPKRRVKIGWYDQDLVCAKCEARFGPYDDYATKLLLRDEAKHQPRTVKDDVVAWIIENYDYKKLKLFLISVLWRAGASSLKQFDKINLGPQLNKAKKLILEDNPGEENDFSFIIARFADDLGQSVLADPHPESKTDAFGDLNSYRFYLGAGYVVYVKVDERPFPPQSAPIAAKPNKPLIILRRGDFMTSKELDSFKTVSTEASDILEQLKKGVKLDDSS